VATDLAAGTGGGGGVVAGAGLAAPVATGHLLCPAGDLGDDGVPAARLEPVIAG